VANGIKTALEQFPVKVPIVVRLTGTNEAEAVKILREIGMTALPDMDEAVQRVVAMVGGAA
jgi:succinyl-CoA synthetase beta subunit